MLACGACTPSTSSNHNNGSIDAPAGGDGGDATPDAMTKPDAAGPTITVMRGVDRASAFSITQATTLKTNPGVEWTGVYIRGPCSAGARRTESGPATEARPPGSAIY